MLEKELVSRMDRIEADTAGLFKIVFQKLDESNEGDIVHPDDRVRIGLLDEREE